MGITRRKFTLEFKTEAAHRVIDTGRSVVDVAGELSVTDGSLARWVRDERRQMETVAGGSNEVAGQDKDLAFLGTAAAYFASNPPKQRDLRRRREGRRVACSARAFPRGFSGERRSTARCLRVGPAWM